MHHDHPTPIHEPDTPDVSDKLWNELGASVGGAVDGYAGIPGYVEPGFEEWYAAGQVVGSALGVVGDVSSIGKGLEATFGGGVVCGTGALCPVGAVEVAVGVSAVTTGAVGIMTHGPRVLIGLGETVKWHHIATDKNNIATVRGGPWTPRFNAIFTRAGLSMNDPANIVWVPGHYGPHPELYHRHVYARLVGAVQGLRGTACASALRAELDELAIELQTRNSYLNRLVAP